MEKIFLSLLNMSIAATWLILAVIVLRLILKKAPKWIMGILWGFVALRLICPFSLESALSLIPSAQTIPPEILTASTPAIDSGVNFVNQAINPLLSGALSPNVAEGINPMQVVTFIASVVWLAGIIAMLSYTLISYLLIHGKVREAVKTDGGYWLCDRISTPFILGVFRPRIFLPSAMDEANYTYVLAHERAHLQRKDYLWKPLGFLLLAIYWFNPVVWIAYILLCRDIELACDEKVIEQLGAEIKKPYSEALINCSAQRRAVAACTLAFGEVGVKARVKGVLNYKRPAFWIIVVAVIVCIVVAVCLLTSPPKENKPSGSISAQASEQYRVSELLFNNSAFSFTETPDNAPQYLVADGKLMWNASTDTEKEQGLWTELGSLESAALSKADFDALLVNGEWYNTDFSELFDQIISINRAESVYSGNKQFFLLLRLNDLSTVLCRGFYDDNDAPFIRWVQALEPIGNSSFSGDNAISNAPTRTGGNPYFNATVLEISGGAILVEPYANTAERRSSDKIFISSNVISANPVPDLKKGDEIRIVYNGEIAESYPAQINTVFAIYALDKNGDIIT